MTDSSKTKSIKHKKNPSNMASMKQTTTRTTTTRTPRRTTTRAYATHVPRWQRFNHALPSPFTPSSSSSSASQQQQQLSSQHPYNRQYSHVYSLRLTMLKEQCLKTVAATERQSRKQENKNKKKDEQADEQQQQPQPPSPIIVPRIIELREDTPSIVVGTVVKETPARPDGVYDTRMMCGSNMTTTARGGEVLEPLRSYCRGRTGDENGDTLILEDESGRVELVPSAAAAFASRRRRRERKATTKTAIKSTGILDENRLATGVVIAVGGVVQPNTGIMVVDRVFYPHPPPPLSRSSAFSPDGNNRKERDSNEKEGNAIIRETNPDHWNDTHCKDAHVMLLSGLNCGVDPRDSDKEEKDDSSEMVPTTTSSSLRRDMLLSYLSGQLRYDNRDRDDNVENDDDDDENGSRREEIPGANICRVIIAGGGCGVDHNRTGDDTTHPSPVIPSSSSSKHGSIDDPSFPIKELDLFLSELCACGIPVDYIPGGGGGNGSSMDPTNANWPQQPLHPCLVQRGGAFVDLLRMSTNPYECALGTTTTLDGKKSVLFLGSDGMNVHDLRHYVFEEVRNDDDDDEEEEEESGMDGNKPKKEERKKDKEEEEEEEEENEKSTIVAPAADGSLKPASELTALELTLRYSHLCPTGPDSIPTFPFGELDPFVMTVRPDVYFAGNCSKFDTMEVCWDDVDDDDHGEVKEEEEEEASNEKIKKGNKTRLICIPDFSKTGEVVLVNLRTLDCEVLRFE